MGVGSRLSIIAQKQPDKTAIVYQGQRMTYREFYDQVCRLRYGIRNLTCHEEPKVAILLENEPEFLTLFFAIISLGGIAIPFDPKWSRRDAVHAMEEAEPDIVISSQRFSNAARYHLPATTIEEVKTTENMYRLNTDEVHVDKPFYIGFTSGSTGNPKGFVRNHHSWLTSFLAAEQAFHYGSDDTIVAPGPLSHSLSLFAAIHTIHIGATFYLLPRFIEEKVLRLIEQVEVTVMFAVPTMLYGLVEQQNSPIEQPITFLSSGAKLNPDLKSRLSKVFPNQTLREYYGASELSFVAYTTEYISAHYPNSVGKAFPGVSITIRDETGNQCKNGETGRIYVTSDFQFSGYIHHREATSNVLTKYGATVGDLGYIDHDGILTVVGREKNMLISGGLNIYPEEVESVIKSFHGIHDAVVIGAHDAFWGQKIVAFIQWKQQRLRQELRAYCKANLAAYKIPRSFNEISEFPYTSSGKIDRKKMVQSFQ